MNPREERAKEFAIKAHGEQKYGDEPYVVHLEAVRKVLADFGIPSRSEAEASGTEKGGDVAVAAWLHDVVEDTSVTREEIEKEFGADVSALVWAVTGVGKNRKERSQSAYLKMQALPAAVTLKLADRIANCEASARNNPSLLSMYRNELPDFAAALAGLGEPAMWTRLRRVLG
jgi:guanosine-3',5'-bis(diphosphate) 3'-pyrophosphohydrolase